MIMIVEYCVMKSSLKYCITQSLVFLQANNIQLS